MSADTLAILRDCAERGLSFTEAARIAGVSKVTVWRYERRHGIEFCPGPSRYGCTSEQYEHLRSVGARMVETGASAQQTPIGAYRLQKSTAKVRGIEFHLTIWEWWTIWGESGHWSERGIGTGYMMCRTGDEGPYAVGNVFIATGIVNHATMRSKGDLPRGVYPSGKQFYAKRKGVHLGRYPTPELAHQAFLRSAGAA